ncbi:MAG TPA: choice-of-anchor Q domain-containing protein, partial [Solirubrobacterales bacterium]|nr:choice-of-anchor Q domain-containing protein [Solirubrobacterales bacterium]
MTRPGGLIGGGVCLAALALLALPAAAGATTFCVPNFHAACPDNGTNVAEANLETAMQASGSDGQADEVRVAPGTYTDPDTFTPQGSDPLTVEGAGAAATELTSSSAANAYVLNLQDRPGATFRDLTVAIPAVKLTGAPGVQLRGTLEDVNILSRATNGTGIPSVLGDGSSFRGGHIYAESGGSIQTGIAVRANVAPGQTFTVEDATISGALSGISLSGPGSVGTVDVRRTRMTVVQVGVSATSGTADVENTQIITPGTPLSAIVHSAVSESATVNANHVSLSHTGGGTVAVANSNVQSGGIGDATVNVVNSATSGYSVKFVRQSFGTGSADVSFSYSNVPSTDGSSGGPGGAVIGPGNIDADPLFADPTANLALLAGSPSIDAADQTGTAASEDIDGNPRPEDGDGDSIAIADQGAYEYPEVADTTPPATTIDTGPEEGATILTAQPTFTFSSNEPGTFECKLDAGPFALCSSPHQLTGLDDGPHSFTVKAID